ncbi:DsbC family protein [Thiomicrorhabdus arctica]|uniref:DsbC family protein n=1 Tax=Thiomicrorhabdus arctica TaxID=131540 RepID=UPI000375DF4B|nr:DsbC family protein [Thiomicrorhabdus arctica]
MFSMRKFLLSVTLVSSVVINTATADTAAIKAQLKTMLPNAPEAIITATPIKDLYQVQVGMTVVYMSTDGKYLLNGNLIALETRDNLTDLAKSHARQSAMQKISESSMIIYPAKGKQTHFITVFSDIDCPYCAKLHKEIPALNEAGITVRYLSYPRSGMGSPSYHKAVSVWCAKDSVKAMDNAMLGKPVANKVCVNPVRDHMMEAKYFEVNGTPNIILDSGELLPGYVPAKELIKILDE